MTSGVPAVEGLFREDSKGVRLTGSRCTTCETPYFPKSSRCHSADCDDSQMQDADFGPDGAIWSYSVQNYPPPPPAITREPYEPYALGVVDLDDGLRVVGRLTSTDPEEIRVGARVQLVVGALGEDAEGSELFSWMFRPI